MAQSTVKLPQSELMAALNARPKHVLISGASRGIGESIARLLGEKNYNVTLAARSYNRLLGVSMDLGTEQSHAVRLDLEDERSIDEAVVSAESRFGPIDVLICNAGVNLPTGLGDLDTDSKERFRKVINVNLIGTYFLAQLAAQHMPSGGRILFVGSCLSRMGVGGSHAYVASKHGVMGLVRGMAIELAPRNIRVNALNPGWVDTKMAHQSMQRIATDSGKTLPQVMNEMLGDQPVRRMIKPSEVAAYVEFLVGVGGDAITGQGIDMSCGVVMV